MECVILFRTNTGQVGYIGEDGDISVFDDLEDAIKCTEETLLLKSWPFQIVELDEL